MALVGPNVSPVKFTALLYTLRLVFNVTGLNGGVLVTPLPLGECTVILPVPNGLGIRHFISVSSLLDVDSPKGRSLPLAASALLPRPLAIIKAQRLLPKDLLLKIFIARLLTALSWSF